LGAAPDAIWRIARWLSDPFKIVPQKNSHAPIEGNKALKNKMNRAYFLGSATQLKFFKPGASKLGIRELFSWQIFRSGERPAGRDKNF
jgi:hypothetical protein